MDNPIAVFRWVTLCAIAWVLILCTGCSTAQLVEGNRTNTPIAGRILMPPLEPRELTRGEHKALQDLFFDIRSRFTYQRDGQEKWTWAYQERGQIVGDCDDFAGNMVEGARQLGIPARRLTAYTEDGTYHMVAEADGMIYDNRRSWPMPIGKVNYEWVKVHTTTGWRRAGVK